MDVQPRLTCRQAVLAALGKGAPRRLRIGREEGVVTQEAPAVSVVVPVFNGARYLREALESVLEQRGFDDLEVIALGAAEEVG